jgi:hypothetical protein
VDIRRACRALQRGEDCQFPLLRQAAEVADEDGIGDSGVRLLAIGQRSGRVGSPFDDQLAERAFRIGDGIGEPQCDEHVGSARARRLQFERGVVALARDLLDGPREHRRQTGAAPLRDSVDRGAAARADDVGTDGRYGARSTVLVCLQQRAGDHQRDLHASLRRHGRADAARWRHDRAGEGVANRNHCASGGPQLCRRV